MFITWGLWVPVLWHMSRHLGVDSRPALCKAFIYRVYTGPRHNAGSGQRKCLCIEQYPRGQLCELGSPQASKPRLPPKALHMGPACRPFLIPKEQPESCERKDVQRFLP